jgi:hypothetical protein
LPRRYWKTSGGIVASVREGFTVSRNLPLLSAFDCSLSKDQVLLRLSTT